MHECLYCFFVFFLQAVWDCRYFSEVRERVWLTVTNWQQTVSANSRLLVQHNVLFRHFSSMFQICLSHINKGTLTDIPICYITAKYVAKYMKCDVAERFVCVLLSEDMLRLLFSLQLLLWIHLFVAIMWLKHKLFWSQKNFAVHPCRIVWCFGINNGAISSTWCTFCQILCLYDSLKKSPTQILCVHAVDSQSCLYTLFHRV